MDIIWKVQTKFFIRYEIAKEFSALKQSGSGKKAPTRGLLNNSTCFFLYFIFCISAQLGNTTGSGAKTSPAG